MRANRPGRWLVLGVNALFILSMLRRARSSVTFIPIVSSCLLWGSALLCCAQNQAAPETITAIASALRDHDFPQALHLCRSALAKTPGDYRIWTLRGMATAGTGDLPKALAAYEQALQLAPDYLPALEGAAQTDFQLGKEDAIPLLLKILGQRPDDRTAHALLGVLESRNNNCADAVVHFKKSAEAIARQPAALVDYGICLSSLDRNDEAVGVFAQVLALDSSNPAARFNLALAQWNSHRAEDALKTLQPLIDATPPDEDALTLAADVCESKGDTVQAVALFRKAIAANPKNVAAYLQFAALSFDHASPQVGIEMIDFGLAQSPDEARLYLARGILLTQLGEFARAADDFDAASRFDPNLQFLDVAEGLVRSQQHDYAAALVKFRAAVKAHPNEAYAHYLLAEALLEEGQQEGSPESKEELRAALRAVELDPHLVAAQDLLASVYLENGDVVQAIKYSRAALAIDANDQQAIYHLIIALRKTDEKDRIPPLLKRLIELRASNNRTGKAPMKYRLSEGATSTVSAPQ